MEVGWRVEQSRVFSRVEQHACYFGSEQANLCCHRKESVDPRTALLGSKRDM